MIIYVYIYILSKCTPFKEVGFLAHFCCKSVLATHGALCLALLLKGIIDSGEVTAVCSTDNQQGLSI